MPIDPSIPLQVNQPQPFNPLALAGQFAGVQNAVNQNKLFQSRQAAGQAFLQGGINADGTPNQQGLLQALKADPNTAMAAQESAGQGQALSQAQMTQQFQRLNYISGINAQLLSQPGQIDPNTVAQTVQQHVGDGIFTADQAKQVLGDMPANPAQIRPWLMQHQIANLQASQQLAASLPQRQLVDAGPALFPTDMNPITNPGGPGTIGKGLAPSWLDTGPKVVPTNAGAPVGPGVQKGIAPQFLDTGPAAVPTSGGVPTGPGVQKGIGPTFVNTGQAVVPTSGGAQTGPGLKMQLSPGEGATRVPVGYDANGNPIMGPLTTVTPQHLGGTAGVMGDGRLPPALRNPNSPDAQGLVTGIGPAKESALSTTGGQSAKAFGDISQQAVAARSQGAMLGNMLGDTTQFVTGPNQGDIKHFQSVLQRISPDLATAFGVKPESIAANESFDKFANQLANAQGAGSDARLAVNQGANPSSTMTPGGVDLVLRQLIGNADYTQARGQLAAQYGDKTNSQQFEAQVGEKLDPRVFQYARMTPQQRATYFNSMPATLKPKFKEKFGFAEQNGLLPNAGQ